MLFALVPLNMLAPGAPGAKTGFGWGCTHDPAAASNYLDCMDGKAGLTYHTGFINLQMKLILSCNQDRPFQSMATSRPLSSSIRAINSSGKPCTDILLFFPHNVHMDFDPQTM
jgi:hypothetical protein